MGNVVIITRLPSLFQDLFVVPNLGWIDPGSHVKISHLLCGKSHSQLRLTGLYDVFVGLEVTIQQSN